MKRQFSLAHLTVLGCTPTEMIHIASRTGYDFVGVRLIPMGVPGEKACRPEDKATLRQMKTALDQTGVKLLDIELARIMADKDPQAYVPAMEAGAALGARHVISSAWGPENMEHNFIIERYMEICDLARPFNLTVDLEFPTFSRLTDLGQAAHVVRTADRPNGGILIDTLHLHFSKAGLAELQALPRQWLHLVHACDASSEEPAGRQDMIHLARDARLYLGEGCIDFQAIMDCLPAVPVSIEIPNAERIQAFGYEEHARRCLETARRRLEAV